MDTIIKELKGLVLVVEELEYWMDIYPLTSDQQIELKVTRTRINKLIKKL